MLHIIIVLGNSVNSVTQKRINRAIEEWKTINNEPFILTKMFLITGTQSETEFMLGCLLDKGIPLDLILTDYQAVNTVTNITNSLHIIERKKLCPCKIIVCTSSFHLPRTAVIANMIMKKYSNILEYIHTNEYVTECLRSKEERYIFHFLTRYFGLSV